MTDGQELTAILLRQGYPVLVVFSRAMAMLLMFPGLGDRVVPMRLRALLAFSLSVSAVFLFDISVEPASPADAFRIPLIEVLFGLLTGFVFRLAIYALEIAGSIAANSTALSQLAGGNAEEPAPAIGQILSMAGMYLLAASGILVRFTEFLQASFELFPVGGEIGFGVPVQGIVLLVSKAFSLAVAFAAPFLVISLIYNLSLGVLNRAMPQMMVALVGAPLISLLALYLLFLTAPYLLAAWQGALNALWGPMWGDGP